MESISEYIIGNITWAIVGSLIIAPIFVTLVFAIKAPYIAFYLIRRNRCLGRDIYREISQADRFMDIWIMGAYNSTNGKCRNAFYLDGWDPQAARMDRVDGVLETLNLISIVDKTDELTKSVKKIAIPKKGKYLFRNWLIFLMLLFLRVSFFGDKTSHIAIAGTEFESVKYLNKLYWLTTVLICLIVVSLFFLLFILF